MYWGDKKTDAVNWTICYGTCTIFLCPWPSVGNVTLTMPPQGGVRI